MTEYSYRLRVNLPSSFNLSIDAPEADISDLLDYTVRISSGRRDIDISKSKSVVFSASGFKTIDEAQSQGARFSDLLTIALSKLQRAADFGSRSPKGRFTDYGISELFKQSKGKVLNDEHGLMVYEDEPNLSFLRSYPPSISLGRNQSDLTLALKESLSARLPLSPSIRLAFDLYSYSYFQRSQDARLLMLMMALEVLFDVKPRPIESVSLINRFIDELQSSENISTSEKSSLIGAMNSMRKESISQAGRRFVTNHLGALEYMGMPCTNFFTHAYSIRSRLIHGNDPFPEWQEVSKTAANLEKLVADAIYAVASSDAP